MKSEKHTHDKKEQNFLSPKRQVTWDLVSVAKKNRILRYPVMGVLAVYLFLYHVFQKTFSHLEDHTQKRIATVATIALFVMLLTGIGATVYAIDEAVSPEGTPLGTEVAFDDTEAPATEVSDTETPDTELSDTESSDTEIPDTEIADTEIPDTENPDTENPDTEIPDTEIPDTQNPDPLPGEGNDDELNIPGPDGASPEEDEVMPAVFGAGTEANPTVLVGGETITEGGYYLWKNALTARVKVSGGAANNPIVILVEANISGGQSFSISGASSVVEIRSKSGQPTISGAGTLSLNTASVTIRNISFTNCSLNNIGGTYNLYNCNFTTSGTIHNCSRKNVGVSTVNMYGGSVTGYSDNFIYNHAFESPGGGAVSNFYGVHFTGNSSSIGLIRNTKDSGLSVSISTLVCNIYGLTATNNTLCVIANEYGTLNLYGTDSGGINISNNSCTDGAVRSTAGIINIKGQVVIQNNGRNLRIDPASFVSGQTAVNIVGALTGSSIGISLLDGNGDFTTGTFTLGYSTYGKDFCGQHPEDPSSFFSSDDSNYYVAFDNNCEAMITSHNYSWQGELISAGNTLYAYCGAAGCPYEGSTVDHSNASYYKITAPNTAYDGAPYDELTTDCNFAGFGYHIGAVYYEGTGLTSYASSTTAPTNAGSYRASVDIHVVNNAYTVYADFIIGGMPLYASDPQGRVLTYNHETQTLLTEGMISTSPISNSSSLSIESMPEVRISSTYGIFYYRVGENGAWSTTIPTATHSGTYRIYYYVKSLDSAYTDIGSPSNPIGYVDTIIRQKPLEAAMIQNTVFEFEYTGSAISVLPSLKDGTYNMYLDDDYEYSGPSSATDAGTYTIIIRATDASDFSGSIALTWKIFEPPVSDPPAEDPPAEDPPAQEPPADEPVVTPPAQTPSRNTGDDQRYIFFYLLFLLAGSACIFSGVLILRVRAEKKVVEKMPWD